MNHKFVHLMKVLLDEARNGNFATKGQAVQRRDELIRDAPAETASQDAVDEPTSVRAEIEHFEDAQIPDID